MAFSLLSLYLAFGSQSTAADYVGVKDTLVSIDAIVDMLLKFFIVKPVFLVGAVIIFGLAWKTRTAMDSITSKFWSDPIRHSIKAELEKAEKAADKQAVPSQA